MKKIVLIAAALMLTGSLASGQSILERLRQKGREVIENVVTGNNNEEQAQPEEQPAEDAPAQAAPAKKQVESAYAKSDFVPGDEIFFEDTFENEQLGEFPSRWDLLEGYVETASLEGRKVLAFADNGLGQVMPLMKDRLSWLPEIFTVEFDLYVAPLSEDGGSTLQMALCFGDRGASVRTLWIIMERTIPWRQGRGIISPFPSTSGLSKGMSTAPGYLYFNSASQYRFSGISDVRIAQGAVPLYDRLTPVGKGSHSPIADNSTDEGRARNRRVEFVKK